MNTVKSRLCKPPKGAYFNEWKVWQYRDQFGVALHSEALTGARWPCKEAPMSPDLGELDY